MPDTFPNICESDGSRQPRTGMIVRVATNGQVRGRALQSVRYEDPIMVYTNLSKAQLDEIRDFYDAHKADEFYLRDHIEDEILTVTFADPPYQFTPYREGAGNRFRGQVNFIQSTV